LGILTVLYHNDTVNGILKSCTKQLLNAKLETGINDLNACIMMTVPVAFEDIKKNKGEEREKKLNIETIGHNYWPEHESKRIR
jgi:hypothetical protein